MTRWISLFQSVIWLDSKSLTVADFILLHRKKVSAKERAGNSGGDVARIFWKGLRVIRLHVWRKRLRKAKVTLEMTATSIFLKKKKSVKRRRNQSVQTKICPFYIFNTNSFELEETFKSEYTVSRSLVNWECRQVLYNPDQPCSLHHLCQLSWFWLQA